MIQIPETTMKRVREEAKRLGMSVEEYVVEALTRSLDPKSRAKEYLEAAREMLRQAQEELEEGDVQQAAEKVWGAVALSIKSYAYWFDGVRIASHSELWEYKNKVAEDLGDWVKIVFRQASGLHACFYEKWCTELDVREVLVEARKLVEAVSRRIGEDEEKG